MNSKGLNQYFKKMKIIKSIPFVYSVLVLINPILNTYGIFYLHYGLLLLGSLCLIPLYFERNGLKFRQSEFIIHFFFFSVLFMVVVNFLIALSDPLLILNSLTYFLIFPLFCYFYLKKFKLDVVKWAKLIVYVGLVNGVVCFVQYFISPTLFGIYNYSAYQIEVVGYRPGALFGSPQVYGLFVVMASIVAFELYAYSRKNLFLIFGFVLIPMAFLSGNKSVLFCIVLYCMLRFLSIVSTRNIFSWRLPVFVILILLLGFSFTGLTESNNIISDNLNRIARVFTDNDNLAKVESEGRLRIYSDFFESYNHNLPAIVVGNGIGHYSSLARDGEAGSNQGATESFILMVFGEYGIIIFIIYSIIWIRSIFNSKYLKSSFSFLNVNLILGITLVFVHAFAHPIFLLFWPFILGSILGEDYVSSTLKKNNTLHQSLWKRN